MARPIDHLDHPTFDQHEMLIVAGHVQRAHARGHQHRQVTEERSTFVLAKLRFTRGNGGGESDIGDDWLKQVQPGACLAQTCPMAGFYQFVGASDSPFARSTLVYGDCLCQSPINPYEASLIR